jgi:CBS domain-containing membrane protein
MKKPKPPVPQQTVLFRIIALLAQFQLGYFVRNVKNMRIVLVVFVFLEGATAMGTITMIAYLTDLPLLFPQLGPSAFILFYTPMSMAASPRNCILSHTMAVVAGLFSIHLLAIIFPEAGLLNSGIIGWYRVAAISLAMGLISVMMIATQSTHPPAAASALIAAMGYLENPVQLLGIASALVLLVLEAFLFNRILGGLPYPIWRPDPKISQKYRALAGLQEAKTTFWGQLADRMFQQR